MIYSLFRVKVEYAITTNGLWISTYRLPLILELGASDGHRLPIINDQ